MLFSPLNFVVLFVYLGGMLGIGVYLARRQKNTEDFFLAGRRMPWPIVAMSMYASLTSAVTYMGLPAAAYKENISLIVVAVVSPLQISVIGVNNRFCIRQFNSRFLTQFECYVSPGSIRHTGAVGVDPVEQFIDDIS